MQRVEFENALKRVAEFGCAENVDWLFDQYGDVGVSQAGLDDAVSAALTRGHDASGANAAGAHVVMLKCRHVGWGHVGWFVRVLRRSSVVPSWYPRW